MVWEDDRVSPGEMRDHLVVVHKTIDQGDPRPVAALLNHLDRQVPALPSFADHGQPKVFNLLAVKKVKGVYQVLETLVGQISEEEKVHNVRRSIAAGRNVRM